MVHAFPADFFKGGTVPDRMYLINLGFVLTVILQITSALVYQLLSMAIRRSISKTGFDNELSESLSFRTCFVYYSIFLILKMINPSMHPVHWLIISGNYSCGECSAYLYVYTVMSQVSAHGCLNIVCDFGPHGQYNFHIYTFV